ncbi:alpha-galactosidase [Fertoebacter nigrum]|uniref:alpha-galactosidase n=1 Tax=Fertoeibacter niger TaxID=2656921 RepID=A0A8X8H285_9RHOB|nr:alpha-galactosidase [Fertoeibacter niger]NUB44852.1 alpha-galactosidase [Fertoeibacter niger]
MKCWRLDSGAQTLVLACFGALPEVVYWGALLPADEDLSSLVAATRNDLTGGMIDALPAVSLTPESGRAFQGQPGLVLAAADGTPLHPALVFDHAETGPGHLRLVSRHGGLTLIHTADATPGGLIALQTKLQSDAPVRLHWLAAPVLPAPQRATEMIDVSGRWTREFHLNRVAWTAGIRLREARTGRSGHEHPPYLILPETGCTNTAGTAFALHYGWSGGHRMVAEELPDGRRLVQFGHASGAETEPGTHFDTAPLYAAFSASGLNGIATAFQRHIRDEVVQWPDAARPRPVHYNCWEAVYFNHNLPDLAAIADRAAAIGAERFVLDDGWFGRRDDDTTSLGDWTVDRNKWPDGLHPLIAHVHGLGMTFGIWFEPEMVNPDSDLFRAHPDWMLGPQDQVTGRNQLVLDLGRAEVRDYLFDAVSAILTEYAIDYIKWDHNRLLPVVDAAQTTGAYALFDRLREAHPGVEIESCASGGGRIDAGILARTHRVWLSDCIDAEERLRMQHDAALFLPASVTGSHVGARKSHTTGRILPMAFRAYVAAQRHMGFEMDLRELTDAETATLQEVTAWWKANRHWTMQADILRLDQADPAVTAEMQLAQDGARFILTAGVAEMSVQSLPRPIRLTGLDPDVRYRVTLKNPQDAPPQSRGPNALKSGPLELSGRYLMAQGLLLPVAWPATLWVVEGERL